MLRPIAACVLLIFTACESPTIPDDGSCEGPYCDVFKDDIVIEKLIPLPYGYTCGDTIPPGSECDPETVNE